MLYISMLAIQYVHASHACLPPLPFLESLESSLGVSSICQLVQACVSFLLFVMSPCDACHHECQARKMLLIIKRAVQTYMQKEIARVFSMEMAWIVFVTG